MKKTVVGSRELKTRLGRYLRQVREGRTLVITDRGRPVAEVSTVRVDGVGDERKLEELIALGLLARESREPLRRIKAFRLAGKPLSSTILESREDRF